MALMRTQLLNIHSYPKIVCALSKINFQEYIKIYVRVWTIEKKSSSATSHKFSLTSPKMHLNFSSSLDASFSHWCASIAERSFFVSKKSKPFGEKLGVNEKCMLELKLHFIEFGGGHFLTIYTYFFHSKILNDVFRRIFIKSSATWALNTIMPL